MNLIIKLGSVCTALAAIGVVVAYVGGQLAWSADIRRLDRQQAATAVDVYSKGLRDAIILREATNGNPTAQKFIDYELTETQAKLKAARERLIELSK